MIRSEFARLDPALPVTVTTMQQNVGRHLERPRFQTTLLAAFALIGVLLAAVGQFGLISCLVTQRAAEIGIRMALGARGADVVAGVMRRTLGWTLAGSAAGIAGAYFLAQYLQPVLFGVGPRDVPVAVSVLMLLIAVSVAAAWYPAARAAAIDPARVLRHD
jgi:putative ABC transport system permease protein